MRFFIVPELTRAVPIVTNFVSGLLKKVAKWNMTEKRRSLSIAKSNKHLPFAKDAKKTCPYVLAIRISESRFKVIDGLAMDLVIKVINFKSTIIEIHFVPSGSFGGPLGVR